MNYTEGAEVYVTCNDESHFPQLDRTLCKIESIDAELGGLTVTQDSHSFWCNFDSHTIEAV